MAGIALDHSPTTEEEYLAAERASVDKPKCEFVEGIVYAMAGASINHVQISSNLTKILGNAFNGRPCRAFSADLKVHLEATSSFVYPDNVAICGPIATYDAHEDIITNPSFIAEVLSPSTEAYDRGKKFDHYRGIDTLEEYFLVSQDRKHVDLYTRQSKNEWLLSSTSGDGKSMELTRLKVSISLDELYENVEFPPPSAPVVASR